MKKINKLIWLYDPGMDMMRIMYSYTLSRSLILDEYFDDEHHIMYVLLLLGSVSPSLFFSFSFP